MVVIQNRGRFLDPEDLSPPPPGGAWSIPLDPVAIYLGGCNNAAQIQAAAAAGWLEHFSGFIASQAAAGALLDEANAQGKQLRLSASGSFGSGADIDYLTGHAHYDHLDGIEFESSSLTDAQWEYARDELGNKLYGYWGQISALTTKAITDVAIGGGGTVTVTAASHGLSNGQRVGISSVGGTTQINHDVYIVANATANTFELSGVDGSTWSAYTSGGIAYSGTYPTEGAWRNRSRLWYPFHYDSPTVSYWADGTASTDSKNITNIVKNPNGTLTVVSTNHGYLENEAVTIRGVAGMTEVNDRQFTAVNVASGQFILASPVSRTPIAGGSYTAYTSGGTLERSNNGRPAQVSARWDSSLYPLRGMAAWKAEDSQRRIHLWLQAFGQPMRARAWNDRHATGVQPGIGHIYSQLVHAHHQGATQVTFYSFTRSLLANRHKDSSTTNSELDYLSNYDLNSASDLSVDEAAVWERTWTWLKTAVADYKAGPGTVPQQTDDDFGYETPYVGVIDGGQSPTRPGPVPAYDHICNTVTQILTAFANVANGETIYIENGTYEFGDDQSTPAVIQNVDDVTICGESEAGVILSQTHATVLASSSKSGAAFNIENVNNLLIKDLTLTGPTDRDQYAGFWLEGYDGITFRNVTVKKIARAGLGYAIIPEDNQTNKNLLIDDCYFEEDRHGIATDGGETSMTGIDGITIQYSTFYNCTDALIDAHKGARNIIIQYNTLTAGPLADDEGDGMAIQSATGNAGSQGLVIRGNLIDMDGNGRHGILVQPIYETWLSPAETYCEILNNIINDVGNTSRVGDEHLIFLDCDAGTPPTSFPTYVNVSGNRGYATISSSDSILYQAPDGTDETVASKSISNITESGGTVTVTSTAHGLANDDWVGIAAVSGMVEINNATYQITNVTANTFDLKNTDGTGWTAYTSGGHIHHIPDDTYTNGSYD